MTDSMERRLEALLAQNSVLTMVLDRLVGLGLPGYYVGAGIVTQTVWNLACGRDPTADVKDIDVVYFDASDLSAATEDRQQAAVEALLPDVPLRFDVKNEARVHIWYEQKFGYPIEPYRSTEHAIATWPTTATAIGVRKEGAGLKVCAPFGLGDLLGLVLRPNKAQITEEIYLRKARRWCQCWPQLELVPWQE